MIIFGWARLGLTSGFVYLLFTVLIFTDMSPLMCFIIGIKLILMFCDDALIE